MNIEARVLITGASSGIGRCLAEKMCGRGYLVVGVGRNADTLEELAGKYPGRFKYVAADLVEPSSLDHVEDVVRGLGGLNVLVNNAGFGLAKSVLGHGEEEVKALSLVNAVRPIQLVLRLVKYMSEGGVVVNVVTAGVHVLMKDFPIYGAAKSALSYASKALGDELRGGGYTWWKSTRALLRPGSSGGLELRLH